MFRRLITGAAGALVLAASTLAMTGSAEAVTKYRSCDDAGGINYDLQLDWEYRYRDANLVLRASVDDLIIKRPDADAGPAADAGVDVRLRVYSGNTKIQDLTFDGIDLDFGIDDQLTLNPKNPRSLAGVSRVTVIVGTDGDGLGNCPLQTFYQPSGLPLSS